MERRQYFKIYPSIISSTLSIVIYSTNKIIVERNLLADVEEPLFGFLPKHRSSPKGEGKRMRPFLLQTNS